MVQIRAQSCEHYQFALINLLGNLWRQRRTGWVLNHFETSESIADHMCAVARIALHFKKDVELTDSALLHDLPEVICGDVAPNNPRISTISKKSIEYDALEYLIKIFSQFVDEDTINYLKKQYNLSEKIKFADLLDLRYQESFYNFTLSKTPFIEIPFREMKRIYKEKNKISFEFKNHFLNLNNRPSETSLRYGSSLIALLAFKNEPEVRFLLLKKNVLLLKKESESINKAIVCRYLYAYLCSTFLKISTGIEISYNNPRLSSIHNKIIKENFTLNYLEKIIIKFDCIFSNFIKQKNHETPHIVFTIVKNYLSLLEKKDITNYVDIGCAEGGNTLKISDMLFSKSTFGHEVEEFNYEEIKGPIIFTRENLTIHKNNSVDLITLLMVIHHNEDINLFKEIRRILKPFGLLVVKEHDVFKDYQYKFLNSMHRARHKNVNSPKDSNYTFRSELHYILQLHGFIWCASGSNIDAYHDETDWSYFDAFYKSPCKCVIY